MKKGTVWDDTFETAIETGKTMAKTGANQIKDTFNPFRMIENVFSKGDSKTPEQLMKEKMKVKQGHTPLDFDKLNKSYQSQDAQKTNALRNRLFQLVRSGEEKVKQEKQQKKEEEKRQIAYTEHEKRRQEAEKAKQQEASAAPQGKVRKSILGGGRKKATPDTAELKPSKGKQ